MKTDEHSSYVRHDVQRPHSLSHSDPCLYRFRCLRQHKLELRACGGMGILVKEKFDSERPPETQASFSLRNPDEVQMFLSRLVSHATAAAAKATS